MIYFEAGFSNFIKPNGDTKIPRVTFKDRSQVNFFPTLPVADLHSKILDAVPPPPSNFLHFHAVFGEIWPNNRFPPILGWRLPVWEILDPPRFTVKIWFRFLNKISQNVVNKHKYWFHLSEIENLSWYIWATLIPHSQSVCTLFVSTYGRQWHYLCLVLL